ncbi:MAG: hypothetical protein H7210_01245 [Pyrinomonadaceae bacterium]|nr:hypothetical protein [Phycisphaerales bacterium]
MPESAPLVIAVSPYHLVTQEVPALCALLLADRVTTLMPEPALGTSREDIAGAMKRSPRFLRFMERIRWSVPLWNDGVIEAGDDVQSVAECLGGTYHEITSGDAVGPLRPMIAKAAAANADEFLDHLCGDLLKGGPDPAFCVPVNACIDSFAVRNDLTVARAVPSSIAQKTESLMLRRCFAFVMPILKQASGHRILSTRRALLPELSRLRVILAAAISAWRVQETLRLEPTMANALDDAAKALTARFEQLKSDVASGDDDEGRRIIDAYVSVTVMTAPPDAVLRSSTHAAKSAAKRAPVGAGASRSTAPITGSPPKAPTDASVAPLTVMVIKMLNVRPEL